MNLYSIIDLGTPTWPPGFYVQPMAINNRGYVAGTALPLPARAVRLGRSCATRGRSSGAYGRARPRAREEKRSAPRGEGCHTPRASDSTADSLPVGPQQSF